MIRSVLYWNELKVIEWLNSTFNLCISRIEQCASGRLFSRLVEYVVKERFTVR